MSARSLFAAVVLLALPAVAQVREAVTVEVVEVPVYVTRGDQPVRGLTRNDFELFVNGDGQPIEYFDVLDYKLAGPSEIPIDRRRMILLLFDIANSEIWAVRKAQVAAEKLVSDSSPADWYAVATNTRKGLGLVIPFTQDRTSIVRALRSLSLSKAGDSLGLAVAESERNSGLADSFSDSTKEGGLFTSSRAIDPNADTLEDLDQKIRDRNARDFLRSMTVLADQLRPLQGNKCVVLLTQVLDPPPTRTSRRFSKLAPSHAPSLDKPYARLEELFEHYRAAGVILNAVDLNGVEKLLSQDIFMMTLSTGGFVAHSRAVDTALQNVRDAHDVAYVLGFHPPVSKSRHNSIRVKLKHDTLATSVRHRTGYSSEPAAGPNNAIVLADVLLNDIPLRGLDVTLDVRPVPEGAAVTASIDGRGILAARGTAKDAHLETLIYVFDRAGTVVSWSEKQIHIDLTKARPHLAENPIPTSDGFKLAPGDYTVKVVVRIAGTEVAGFGRAEVGVR